MVFYLQKFFANVPPVLNLVWCSCQTVYLYVWLITSSRQCLCRSAVEIPERQAEPDNDQQEALQSELWRRQRHHVGHHLRHITEPERFQRLQEIGENLKRTTLPWGESGALTCCSMVMCLTVQRWKAVPVSLWISMNSSSWVCGVLMLVTSKQRRSTRWIQSFSVHTCSALWWFLFCSWKPPASPYIFRILFPFWLPEEFPCVSLSVLPLAVLWPPAQI